VVGKGRNVIEAAASRHPLRGTSCTSESRVVLHTSSEHLTIEVVGELDRGTPREMMAVLLPAIRGGSRIVHLDISRVVFVGSSGVRALAIAQAEAAERGAQVVLLRPSPAVRDALAAAGLDLQLDDAR
jgi:anti-anti-sigma factor